MWHKKLLSILAIIFLLALFGCSTHEQKETKRTEINEKHADPSFEIKKAEPQRLENIFGIGYPGNDEGLYIASQNGIKIFSNGSWLEGTTQKHEYMGFQTTLDGFIASGHPEKDSKLQDPLGIVKSIDKGASLEQLAFYGESNFYFLSSSYNGKTMYIINQEKNSKLKLGVYMSEDEGKSWEKVMLKGLDSNTLGMIAVHPENNIMAMSTREGIYYSEDKGQNIKKITNPIMTTALAFSEDSLYYSSAENNKVLFYKMDLQSFNVNSVNIPFLSYDNPITYIAVNNKDQNKLSFATYLNDVYESADGGQTWKLVLKNGRIE
ncbi:hypothetical protein H0173_18525 [Bacillus sp. S/N-304-OC-R1]|nr:hypothetical protein [Bacillus sp. S/N-304-OC-R1]